MHSIFMHTFACAHFIFLNEPDSNRNLCRNRPLFRLLRWNRPRSDKFCDLGVVHNCQHLCIRTEGGGGHDASVLFLNVDILLMLPPGGYD